MSKVSKLNKSRNSWKKKSIERGCNERASNKKLKRIKRERNEYKKQLRETLALLKSERKKSTLKLSKPDLVHISLQLFLSARISFRAVSRVLGVMADHLNIAKAPCHQSVINWLLKLSLVKMQLIDHSKPASVPVGSFSNGFIWMIDTSIGIDDGKILAVLALDINHYKNHAEAPTLKNVNCVGVAVSPSWTGENISVFLKKIIASQGRPSAYLKDGGTDLKKAVKILEQEKLGSPSIDDVSHKMANLVKREYADHPLFDTFISACGQASKNLKQTILACLTPPKVTVKSRFMNIHKLVTWADRILKHSPPGRASEGSLLAKLRNSLDALPQCKQFIHRFSRDVRPLLSCQKIIKQKGLSNDTYNQCIEVIDDIPESSQIRLGFTEWADAQLAVANELGLGFNGLPISSDTIESLFGVGKRHGAGDVKDANRISMRLPALCGDITVEDAHRLLEISYEQQQNAFSEVKTTVGQRRKTLAFPGKLEGLQGDQKQSGIELIPRPKNRYKNIENPGEPYDSEKLLGPKYEATANYFSAQSERKNKALSNI